ncbi:histidine phosphatase superfamily branch 2 protein [Nitzschia inconspicua]|uniref:Histidine phosphatase superfamily branch 2 protein n=1 Tax=Nitzschia inconspicua TaxID=303405 RepID=A0A9K3LLJ2_9STRA|nr:histidine phosphatase superfamily branch 2 protein [Nitzschia inconspicua]
MRSTMRWMMMHPPPSRWVSRRILSTTTSTSAFPCFDVNAGFSSKVGLEHHWPTNDGIIEGVWVFVRHGDRAPSRPLSPNHKQFEEAEYWMRKLPRPDSMAVFKGFCRIFPPVIHPSNNGQFLDTTRAPFGFLTHTGLKQTNELGTRLFQRYDRHGYLQRKKRYDHRRQHEFLEAWDLRVYSTNYLRTIMSAQSFLDGLLGTNCYFSIGDQMRRNFAAGVEESEERSFYGGEIRIPNHETVRIIQKECDASESLVQVKIRGPQDDTLNAFDRSPEMMSELVSVVISSTEFQERDGAAAPLAARLANILPGLARKKKNTTGFNAAPSGINWIEACDHFVCRKAHNLELSRFSDFEHDDRVESILEAMSYQTIAHLAWRFRQWYKNPTLLANIAAPPLREVCDQLMAATDMAVGGSERRPFTIYSCHDITILGLLYGIGADFLAGDYLGGWRFWPPYASSLVFELVRIPENEGCSHVVRILLNGKPVFSVHKNEHYWAGKSPPAGRGPFQMLYAEDFNTVVSNLEKAGGRKNYMSKEDGPHGTSDMSSWTG